LSPSLHRMADPQTPLSRRRRPGRPTTKSVSISSFSVPELVLRRVSSACRENAPLRARSPRSGPRARRYASSSAGSSVNSAIISSA
jgi:hypothetical protein